jgi:hypothetical protein
MSKVRIYNKTLCPKLWTDMKLNPQVRINLLKLAKDFYEKTTFQAPIKDIYLMGSTANFNWTPESDIDVHILIDFNHLQMQIDTANKMTRTASSQWNSEHEVLIKGHPVEMNLQNSADDKPHVTGIYSLVTDSWIRIPKKENVAINRARIITQYTKLKGLIEKAIQTNDRDYMKSFKEYLDALRQYGLDTKGELSADNITFKVLRAKGYIKKLKDAITRTYDDSMSVDESNQGGYESDVDEVTQKDVKSRHPYPSMPQDDAGNPQLDQMTLDNIKAMRDKAGREYYAARKVGDNQQMIKALEDVKLFNDEMKRRIKVINAPFEEGYGAGKPEDDPKIPKGKRWTVKYDSTSDILKEALRGGLDYIGTTYQGSIKGVPVPDASSEIHRDHGMLSGVHGANWRYYHLPNKVTWDGDPNDYDKMKVDDFLRKRGILDTRHKIGYVGEGVDPQSNEMSVKDMIEYLRQHHGKNLHKDYLNYVNTFNKFVLEDIPINSIKTDLDGLDKSKIEKYKKMDFSKSPPIVIGDGYILDGYHRANVAKSLGISNIKGYVGIKSQEEGFDPQSNGGPNAGYEGSGGQDGNFYQDSIDKMRKMEEEEYQNLFGYKKVYEDLETEGKFRKSKKVEHVMDVPMFSIFINNEKLPTGEKIVNTDETKKDFDEARHEIHKLGFPSMHANVVITDLSKKTNNNTGIVGGNAAQVWRKGKYIELDFRELMLHNKNTVRSIVHEWSHLWMFHNSKAFKSAIKKIYRDMLNKADWKKHPHLNYKSEFKGKEWDLHRTKLAALNKWVNDYGMSTHEELWATGIEYFSELPPEHKKAIIGAMMGKD